MTSPRAGSEKPLVLLIDDDEDSRFLYNHYLSSAAGYRVEEAGDGAHGIELATSLLPDIIVLDMTLPGLNGWDALRRLRSDSRTAALPVVCLSGHHLESPSRDGASFDEVLTKPCLPSTLAECCARLVPR